MSYAYATRVKHTPETGAQDTKKQTPQKAVLQRNKNNQAARPGAPLHQTGLSAFYSDVGVSLSKQAQFQAVMQRTNIPLDGTPHSINTVVQRVEAGGQHPVQRQEDFKYLQRTIGNQAVVQLLDRMKAAETADIHKTAAAGVQGTGSPLPHLDKIQQSFGQHDVSGVQAFTGTKAATASKAIGAQAYTTGNKIAFASPSPDLHTTAHEATHVLQQASGVQLDGGVGEVGDSYERHADAVADRVVKGQSAEDTLNRFSVNTGSSNGGRDGTNEGVRASQFKENNWEGIRNRGGPVAQKTPCEECEKDNRKGTVQQKENSRPLPANLQTRRRAEEASNPISKYQGVRSTDATGVNSTTQRKENNIVQRIIYNNYNDKTEMTVADAVNKLWAEGFQAKNISKRQLTSVVGEFASLSKTTDVSALKQVVDLRIGGISSTPLVDDSDELDTVEQTHILGGKVLLLIPKGSSNVVTMYGHGEPRGTTAPIPGVKLGYYCDDGQAALQPLYAGLKSSPSNNIQDMSGGQIPNYKLWKHDAIDGDILFQDILTMVRANQITYALFQGETSTEQLVPVLKGLGYTEIRAVHCRGAVDQVERGVIQETRAIDINEFRTGTSGDRPWSNPMFETDYIVGMAVSAQEKPFSLSKYKITEISTTHITVTTISEAEFMAILGF